MGTETKLILFALVTVGLVWFSRASLLKPQAHGFYRFWAWEVQIVMVLLQVDSWFTNAFRWHQLISWILLVVSLVMVLISVVHLHSLGKPVEQRGDAVLIGFEKTTRLVRTGAYRYIRHPMYASLLYLTWGVFFKSPGWLVGLLGVISTLLLLVTAVIEERENFRFFGEEYRQYMQVTRRFIPFVF